MFDMQDICSATPVTHRLRNTALVLSPWALSLPFQDQVNMKWDQRPQPFWPLSEAGVLLCRMDLVAFAEAAWDVCLASSLRLVRSSAVLIWVTFWENLWISAKMLMIMALLWRTGSVENDFVVNYVSKSTAASRERGETAYIFKLFVIQIKVRNSFPRKRSICESNSCLLIISIL